MVCSKCGKCCTSLFFTFPNLKLRQSDIEYYKYHNIDIEKFGRTGYRLKVNNRCEHLTKDNLCDIFETRPDVCREKMSNSVKFLRPEGCTE